MALAQTVPVVIKPTAGFCVKSKTVQDASYQPEGHETPMVVAKDTKIFINVAWDVKVPLPPDTSVIRNLVSGDKEPDKTWSFPSYLSPGRLDVDKAGNQVLVFDYVTNSSLRNYSVKKAFKIFLIEDAMLRIEKKTSLVLSREVGTPNISAKGKLIKRTIDVPGIAPAVTAPNVSFALEAPAPAPKAPAHIPNAPAPTQTATLAPQARAPLIEEIPSSSEPKSKGILKTSENFTPKPASVSQPKDETHIKGLLKAPLPKPLAWKWEKQTNGRLKISVSLPDTPRQFNHLATLDIEERRFLLHVPCPPRDLKLDVNLSLTDAEISKLPYKDIALTLKRQRKFDVDGAKAEWHIAEQRLDIIV